MDVEKLESILSVNNIQIFSIISVTLLSATATITPQTGVFYNAIPKHRCLLPEFDNNTLFKNVSEDEITSLAIPLEDSCHRYIYNTTECLISGNLSCLTEASDNRIMKCDNGYYYDKSYYEKTVVSEWDLVCDKYVLNSVIHSLYFVGILVGSIPAGYIFDWFGRKLALLILSVGLMGSGIGCTLASTLTVYCVFRFLEGATSVTLYGAAFSYASEIAGQKLRPTVATFTPLVSSITHTLFPVAAYFLRDWRDLNLTCGLLSLMFIITWPFIPETPSWLLMKGRELEARKVLNRYAKSKGTIIKDEDWRTILETEKKTMKFVNNRAHLTDLFRRPFIRIVSLVVMYNWFAVNCVYYGLVLNVGSLIGNPYLNAALNGSTEIISVVVFAIINKRYGANQCLIVGMFGAGSLCVVTMITGKIDSTSETALGIMRWASIAGKLFTTIAFNATYQYTNDVFPTITRGKAMAITSTCARLGAIIIPFVIHAKFDTIWVTQALFGVLGVSAGLTMLAMPKTSPHSFTTTIQEAEEYYRKEMTWIAKFIGKQTKINENKFSHVQNSSIIHTLQDVELEKLNTTQLAQA
ncbi:organic cation transporter protein-like [Styela clava]